MKEHRTCAALSNAGSRVCELLTLGRDASKSCEAIDRIARVHWVEIDRKIAELAALRSELARVISSCSRGMVAACKISETLTPAHRWIDYLGRSHTLMLNLARIYRVPL